MGGFSMRQISEEQLQKLADYLVTQPYAHVAGLIQMISALKPVDVPKIIEEKPDSKKQV